MSTQGLRPLPMIRISLPYLWGVAEDVEPLVDLPTDETPWGDVAFRLYQAHSSVQSFVTGSVFSPTFRSSKPLAQALLRAIDKGIEKGADSAEATLGFADLWPIKNAYLQFKTALLAELATFPAYFVTQKGSHDTLTLLDQPWLLFPSDLMKKAPEALFDVAEAGKALSYDLPTACGYHLFRATEAVLRRYYTHVTGGKPHPKVRNIMVYVQAMRKAKCGDEVILSVIEQLSKLHRNPLIHPEVALSLDEAISIHGISRSAVTAMLATLPELAPTTTNPVAQ